MINLKISATPNPNSIKVTLDQKVVEQGSLNFDSADEAAAHPLARSLFAIHGVKSVFMLGNFITVTKETSADWKALSPEIEETIRQHYDSM
jgi:hypothetical protein